MIKTLFATTALAAALISLPAHAQMASEMSCADFTALDESAQMAALEGGDGMMANDMEADSMASDDMMEDEMATEDAMEGDDMAADDMEADGMESDDMEAGEMANGDDAMAHDGMSAMEVAEACAEQPDMMVGDVMAQ